MRDEEILNGLRRRDPDALSALVDLFAGPVYALCARILGSAGTSQDVEECAADSFHAAWRQAEHFDHGRAPLRTWVLMLAKYTALSRRRSLTRTEQRAGSAPMPLLIDPPQGGPTLEDTVAGTDERKRLQAALNELTPLDRSLVYRRYFLDESVNDLAMALGLSRQAADNRLWRARRTLRTLLERARKEAASHE